MKCIFCPVQGEILELRLKDVKPTQPDDGILSMTTGPISIYRCKGTWLILHGNHRYHDILRRGSPNSITEFEVSTNPEY